MAKITLTLSYKTFTICLNLDRQLYSLFFYKMIIKLHSSAKDLSQ
jgi:hypothetical protein